MGPASPVVESLRVGDVTIDALWDAEWSFEPALLVPQVPAESWRPHTGGAVDAVPSRVLAFLVRDAGRTILVDAGTGSGNGWPSPGRLVDSLAAGGVAAAEVDTVVLTHLHSDHLGGATIPVGAERVPGFPNARHLIPRADWIHFTSRAYLDSPSTATKKAIMNSLPVLEAAGLIDLVEPATRVSPAVDLLATPGHTPGSLTVRVQSRGAAALLIGDAAHHQAQLAEPDWSSGSDLDPVRATASRRAIAAEALRLDAFVAGAHFQAGGPVFARMSGGEHPVWGAAASALTDGGVAR